MIKRILVALDSDLDTQTATTCAIEIARRYDAEVNGLTVIDRERIESSARGGGIGSFYYAQKLRERLTEESRETAQAIMRDFSAAMEGSGVRYGVHSEEGVPFERIVEDMKYHDLLIMGKDPHFFYAHPDKDTNTVARVVKNTIAATLVVGPSYDPVKKVLFAYDGSNAAARTIQEFMHLSPFGIDIEIEILSIFHRKDEEEADLLLTLMKEYVLSYGFGSKVTKIDSSSPAQEIIEHANKIGANLLVAGAHSASAIKRVAFGSTTSRLIEQCPVPLFVDN
ncbi:MAG: universal stress protein [Rhodothermales bacterium]|nr:universal stress protein [Rhodothermales bacterium]